MLNIDHVRNNVIRPALIDIDLWSWSAENLLVGTGLVESNFKHLVQHDGGPALSVFQIEPETYRDIVRRLLYKPTLKEKVIKSLSKTIIFSSDASELITNLKLSTIIARLKYWFNPEPLPDKEDIGGLASYWGRIYNTRNDPNQIKRFMDLYDMFGEHPVID